jgi:hypothetical protein
MGVLANHVPSIEQLKPGIVEIIEEGGATKQYFRTSRPHRGRTKVLTWVDFSQCPVVSPSSSPTLS